MAGTLIGRGPLVIAVWTFLGALPAFSQEQPPSVSPFPAVEPDNTKKSAPAESLPIAETNAPFAGPWFTWPKMTGDWFGHRTDLASHGITLDISTTQYYQGVASGGLEQSFPYGGRNDYFLNLDGEKLGLWKGFFVTLHGESRYGESANSLTGAMLPVNLMLAVPQPNGSVTALTGMKLTQFLSEDMLVYAGKINTFDEFKQPLTGAGLLNGFMNTGLMLPAIYARTIPYSTYGAGFAYLKEQHPILSVLVLDTNNTPTVSGFDSFFNCLGSA